MMHNNFNLFLVPISKQEYLFDGSPLHSSILNFSQSQSVSVGAICKNEFQQVHPSHVPPQKSWIFLSNYLNDSQNRYEKMKKNINGARELKRQLLIKEAETVEKEKSEVFKAKLVEEQRKAQEESIYERPQARALAEKFTSAAQDHFKTSSVFEMAADQLSKNYRMKLKMGLNRRTGQITDSLQQIKSVVVDLVQFCFESKQFSSDAYSYCLVLLASKILAQAESQVSLHPPSAFPLALVAVEISTSVSEFSSVLMASLIKKCCFAVPRYPKKTSTDEAYKIELGYLTVDGKIKESDTAYFERMSGLISFFAAVVQTNSSSGKPNLVGLNVGWTWLASILNMPPRSITPVLLVSFLEQASFSFYRKYGPNFDKLIRFIADQYLSLLPKTCIAAKTRLELLCNEIIKSGPSSLAEPVGRQIAP